MSLLTEQEIQDLCYVELDRRFDEVAFARAIEAKVIAKIKAQGPFGFVLVNTMDEEAVMFYSPDMKPEETQLKDKFSLVSIYTLPEGDLKMPVIVVGEDSKEKRRTSCCNCGAVIEYTLSDTKIETVKDYSGGSDTYRRLVCPRCKEELTVAMY